MALEVRTAGKLGERFHASEIVDLCEEAGIEIPGLKSANCDDASRRVGVLLKRAFGELDVVEVDGLTVARAIVVPPRLGGGSRPTKVYRFCQ